MIIGLATPDAQTESLAFSWLADLLRTRGHTVSDIDVPLLAGDLDQQLLAVEACLSLDVSHLDLLISGSAPGWFIPHHRHLIYSSGDELAIAVTASELDLERCERPEEVIAAARAVTLSNEPLVQATRHHLDRTALAPRRISRVAAFSEFAALRFEQARHHAPIMVTPPIRPGPLGAANTPPRLVVFAESSFETTDHCQLLIDGFATIDDRHAELRIAGDGPQRQRIEAATDDRRVHFLGPIGDRRRRQELLNASSAVVLTVGTGWSHPAATALQAAVPLVVPADAGGITEVVEHGVNGLVVDPTADQLAWAVRHVHSSTPLRWQLGLNAQRRSAELDSSRLLDEIEDLLAPARRPHVLTLSTYPVDPMVGGGQRRARFQSRSMADRCDVTVLVNTSPTERIRRRLVEAGLSQIEIPKSAAQREAELDMFHAMAKTPVDDITAAELSAATPEFGTELHRCLSTADVVIGTQPFLIPALPANSPPIVHDSQNVEAELKADLLPDSAGGRWLLERVRRVETEAGQRAAVVTACTEHDAERLTEAIGSNAAPARVIGNGVDTMALPLRTPSEHRLARSELLALCGLPLDDDRPIGLFIGSWHPPNISAARLVLQLAEHRPDWTFLLAGSHTSEFADEPIPDNVTLLAVFAESLLWPLLAGADVALNPMRSGGGSNLKLFDYLAAGTPIVSTPIGARGLADPDCHCIIADPSLQAFSDAIDRAMAEASTDAGLKRIKAGRELVEQDFDWRLLGDRWSSGILELLEIAPGPLRSRSRPLHRPVLADTAPPSEDPVLATMQLLGLQARLTPPSPQEVSMDPALRERLKRANDNRNIGRELPDGARFRAPKKALIRIGHALTNEQVIYNEAIVEAVEQLAVSMRSLETEQRELRRTVEELNAENRALQRRLEVLE